MATFKYKNVKTVEVKDSFNVFKHDEEFGETEILEIPKGTKGVIVNMGNDDGSLFGNRYDIQFNINGEEVEISMYEQVMDESLILNE